MPPRHVHEIGGGVTSLRHAGLDRRAGYYGVKIVNIAAGNAARGLPALHASYLLHDASTGAPLALIDGDQITARRTAAASALAASWLARADARHLLVVGAGQVARLLPAAYRDGAADRAGDGLGAPRRRGRGPGASAGRRRRRRRARATISSRRWPPPTWSASRRSRPSP